MIALLALAVLVLAAIGAKTVLAAAFGPWHLLLVLAEVGAVVLVLRLLWVEIGNLGKKP